MFHLGNQIKNKNLKIGIMEINLVHYPTVSNNVWIGMNLVTRKGVKIEEAVVVEAPVKNVKI